MLFNAFILLRMSALHHTDDGRDIELTAHAAWVFEAGGLLILPQIHASF